MTGNTTIRRSFAAALCTLCVWLGTAGLAAAADARRGPTVVEFFTAQGCPACLPVLDLVSELARQPDVLVLSLHVDYWDYMGWKDPFAMRASTRRQRLYASHLGKPYVYTPQLIVHGRAEAAAQDREDVLGAIRDAKQPDIAPVSIERRPGQGVVVRVGAGPYDGQAMVWLALFDSKRETLVTRGANTDKTVVNTNVVRILTPIGSWNGQPVEIPLSIKGMLPEVPDRCAVLVQGEDMGPVLGAAVMEGPPMRGDAAR